MPAKPKQDIFGLAAEFSSPENLLAATQAAHAAGYRKLEAYSPYAVPGLADALGFHTTRVPLLTFIGGVLGASGGYFMMWYANVVSYPWNIGGRPPNSWPAFIPITFEMMVLGAALMAVLGMIVLNGLPQPYHPMFNLPNFELATQTHFFLCIESSDPLFELDQTRHFLLEQEPASVLAVPW